MLGSEFIKLTVFSPGIYSCYDANTDKVVLSNKPFGANARFSLEVRQTDENEYMQTAEWITENGRQAQSRYYRNEVWSDWATSSGSSGGGGGSGGTTDIDDLLPTDVEREKLVSLVMKQLVDAMYPVGSIYIATSSNVNPNILFVGTKWNKIEGAFLLGSSTSYTLNSKGGAASATVSLNHNHLTGAGIDRDGSIKVVAINKWTEGGSGNLFAGVLHNPADNYGTLNHNINLSYTANTNVSRTVNTMPPYHVVDIWRRDE